MPSDRITDALTRPTRRAPVVDLVADDDAPVTDALSALLPSVAEATVSELTEAQRLQIIGHERMKRRKREAEATASALGRDIVKALEGLLELKAALQWGPDDWEAVEDGLGFQLSPFEFRRIWPAYRIDPATDQKYERADLIGALREAGYGELIVESPDKDKWPSLVSGLTKTWRAKLGGSGGVRNAAGEFVDAFDNVLVGDECDDPAADRLALPPALRRVAEPVEPVDIRYTRREVASRAVAERDAVERAADAEADKIEPEA